MIRLLIRVYIFVLIADAILSYLPQYRNTTWAQKIRMIADFTCAPIRKVLPPDLPFDFSPLIVILLLQVLVAIW
jgi:YggT family protein